MAARIFAPVFLLGSVACGIGCGPPALLQCRVAAVESLPDDPTHLTFADVVDVAERLHACKVQHGDAGHE